MDIIGISGDYYLLSNSYPTVVDFLTPTVPKIFFQTKQTFIGLVEGTFRGNPHC